MITFSMKKNIHVNRHSLSGSKPSSNALIIASFSRELVAASMQMLIEGGE